MNQNWNLRAVAVFTRLVSLFSWLLILPTGSKASAFLLVPLTIAFGEGVFIFARGFVNDCKYRVLAGLSRLPIRSMAMGLVGIRGKAFGEQQVISPVSQTPRFHYRVLLKARGRERDRDDESTRRTYCEIDGRGVGFRPRQQPAIIQSYAGQ